MLVFFFPIFCFDFILLLSNLFRFSSRPRMTLLSFSSLTSLPFVCFLSLSFFFFLSSSFFLSFFFHLSKLLILGLGEFSRLWNNIILNDIFLFIKISFFPKNCVFSHSLNQNINSFFPNKKKEKKKLFLRMLSLY